MDSFTITGITFACTFGGALLGIYLRRILPESHLSPESKDVVKMGTGLIASLSALVLGLLVASAKNTFDSQRSGFQTLASNLIILDRSLKFYGPETKECRELLAKNLSLLIDLRWPAPGSPVTGLDSQQLSENSALFLVSLRDLTPKTEAQKSLQAQALQLSGDLAKARWQLSQGEEGSITTPFLVVLVLWLTVLFITFGLFSPWNATVIGVLCISAASMAGALFLIQELDQPLHGWIQISSKPLRDALVQIGH